MPLKPTTPVQSAFGGQTAKGMKGGKSSLADKYKMSKGVKSGSGKMKPKKGGVR